MGEDVREILGVVVPRRKYMHLHPKVECILAQLAEYKPEKIILFGSYAYGEPAEDSDVDIVLIKKTTAPFHERQKKVRLLLKTLTPVDVFVFTPEEFERAKKDNPLVKEIAELGKVVYG